MTGVQSRQIRVGSVLIADVVNFLKHEPSTLEQVADVLDDLYSTIMNAVLVQDGEVVKWLGDGALCAFWKENHAFSALKAAFDIGTGFEAFARRQGFTDSGVTVSIATGEMISGQFGTGTAQHYDVFGEPVVCTASIMPDASGEITICEATYKLIKDRVTVTQLADHPYFGTRYAVTTIR